MDNRSTREFIETHTGCRWLPLLIEMERDESGNPVTIRPEYIGRDDTANYLQSEPLPVATVRAMYRALIGLAPRLAPAFEQQGADAVLRLSIEKARAWEAHAGLREATAGGSLRHLAENGVQATGTGR